MRTAGGRRDERGVDSWILIVVMSSSYLEPSHVPRISGVLQAILVALEEELEEKPGNKTEH